MSAKTFSAKNRRSIKVLFCILFTLSLLCMSVTSGLTYLIEYPNLSELNEVLVTQSASGTRYTEILESYYDFGYGDVIHSYVLASSTQRYVSKVWNLTETDYLEDSAGHYNTVLEFYFEASSLSGTSYTSADGAYIGLVTAGGRVLGGINFKYYNFNAILFSGSPTPYARVQDTTFVFGNSTWFDCRHFVKLIMRPNNMEVYINGTYYGTSATSRPDEIPAGIYCYIAANQNGESTNVNFGEFKIYSDTDVPPATPTPTPSPSPSPSPTAAPTAPPIEISGIWAYIPWIIILAAVVMLLIIIARAKLKTSGGIK